MIEVTSRLTAHHVPHILYEGTLLGLVRDGDIIPWDTDVDLAVFEPIPKSFYDFINDTILQETHVAESREQSNCWKIYSKERYFQQDYMRLLFKRTYIDICFIGSRPIDENIIQNGNRSMLSLWGYQFYVPGNVQRALTEMYGPHYMIPNRKDDRGAGFNSYADQCPIAAPKFKFIFLFMAIAAVCSSSYSHSLTAWKLSWLVNLPVSAMLVSFTLYLLFFETRLPLV